MTLILETGSGIPGANSYVPASFVTSYLTARGREAENLWSTSTAAEQDEACIAATDYIDSRWGPLVRGTPEFFFSGAAAQGALDIVTDPADGDTVTVGERTYTFRTALSTFATDEVAIGVDTATTATNLIAALAASSDGAGTLFSATQQANRSATGAIRTGTTKEVLFTAIQFGEAGNDTPFAIVSPGSDLALLTATFQNGVDTGPQPLVFPRSGLVVNGRTIKGIPRNWKNAVAEYAVRARSASLYRDPTVDATGAAVVEKEEKVGPITERTRYFEGTALTSLIKPYPAADQMIVEYLGASGGTYR